MESVLEVKDLKKGFSKNQKQIAAVRGISFSIQKGECVGLVGESGCGKSTTAKLITHLLIPDEGSIQIMGNVEHHEWYRHVQMVFQSPQDSFDPRRTLGDGVMESLRNQGMSKKDAKLRVKELFCVVELDPELAERYPHQVSGGQCQRAAIARALAIKPELIICDEATSALDVTVQAQIVELLKRLQNEAGVSYLFICHDLALVQKICDRVLVMHDGEIVEEGTPEEVILHPKNDYTRMLVDSVF